jgi:hypothetical protein
VASQQESVIGVIITGYGRTYDRRRKGDRSKPGEADPERVRGARMPHD